MRWNVLWPSEDIYHVDFVRHIDQLSVNFFTKNFGHLRIVHRHRNNFESSPLHILRNVERRLIELDFCLYAQHSDCLCVREQVADSRSVINDVVAPHISRRLTRMDADIKSWLSKKANSLVLQ